nr:MAG TPA_asm: hypothetical protein [Caudoviricetes sp.]
MNEDGHSLQMMIDHYQFKWPYRRDFVVRICELITYLSTVSVKSLVDET